MVKKRKFLLRFVSVNLAVLAAILVIMTTKSNTPLAYVLGIGLLTSGLVYPDKAPASKTISGYILGLIIGSMAGYGTYLFLIMDWRWSLPPRLIVLAILLVVSSVPQVLQIAVSDHNPWVILCSLLVTGIAISIIFFGLLPTPFLSLNNSLILLFLIPSLITVSQHVIAKYLFRSG